MPVCNFFLQGRCRYGEKCWNEHPRGGTRGGGYNDNRSSGQQQSRGGGGGGFGNRVWVNPSQQKGAYIQPSSFSSHGSDDWGRGGGGGGGGSDWGRGGGGSDWGRGGGGGGNDWSRGGGGGRRDNLKSSEFSFSSQNKFSALSTSNTFDRGGRGGGSGGGSAGDEDDDKKLEIIQMDMDIWESSGQWGFSCYSGFKTSLSGFTDLSPEELRLEYYSTRASGDLQGYLNGVNQLLSQWKNRVQELKIMNAATRAALLAELNGAAPQTSSISFGSTTGSGFGSSASGFGNKDFGATAQASSFSFASSAAFGSSAAPSSSSSGFGSTLAAPTQPPSGFGGSSAPSSTATASSFSFAAASTDKPAAASGFGSASGFSFSSTANTGGGFGATAGSSSTFGQASGGFGATAPTVAGAGSAAEASDSLFSPESKLTQEELNQFKAKRFTLGQIPLKPPPANMLVV